jgi:hypothetical protein
MLDKIPAPARHLLLALAPVLLGWASAEGLPWLQGQFPAWAGVWVVIQQAVLWATPLTRQYGAGRTPPT